MKKSTCVIRFVLGAVLCVMISMSHGQTVAPAQTQNEKQPDSASPPEKVDPSVQEMRLEVNRTPNSAEAHNKLGVLLAQAGDLKAGIQEFETAVRLNPDFAKAHYNLGVTNISLANWYQNQADVASYREARAAAFRAFLQTSQLDPKFPHVHDHLGALYEERGESSPAITEFQKAIVEDPGSAQSYYNLGLELTAENKWQKAREALEKATELGPNLLQAHLSLLEVISRGDLHDAIRETRQAVRVEPTSGVRHAYLGYLLSRDSEMVEAKSELRTSVLLSPGLSVTHFLLGQILEQNGETSAVEEQYRAAARLSPDQAVLHKSLGRLLLKRKAEPQAIAELGIAASLDPTSSEIAYMLGRALRQAGKLEEGDKELEISQSIKEQESGRTAAAVAMAEGLNELESGEIQTAIQSFHLAISKEPDIVTAHRYLGIAFARKGDLGAATNEFRLAVRLNPEDAATHLNLGLALARQGNVADAISELRFATKQDPNLAQAHCDLALLLLKEGDESTGNEELSRAQEMGACTNAITHQQ
jgi:Flp pilus assembly protein TadD